MGLQYQLNENLRNRYSHYNKHFAFIREILRILKLVYNNRYVKKRTILWLHTNTNPVCRRGVRKKDEINKRRRMLAHYLKLELGKQPKKADKKSTLKMPKRGFNMTLKWKHLMLGVT